MALSQFTILVSTDNANGIAKDGEIPWVSKETQRYFRDLTIGNGKNAVIMGRVTYESLPDEAKPLEKRKNVVISRTWRQENYPGILVYASLIEALAGLGTSLKNCEDVFILGGEQLFQEAIRDFLYLCKRIVVTRFKNDYSCDQFFPFDKVRDLPSDQDPTRTREYVRHYFSPEERHDEYKYLKLLIKIRETGEVKQSNVTSIFGASLTFNLTERLPIITTRKILYENIIEELLFCLSGNTNTKVLESKKIHTWKGDTSAQKIQDHALLYEEGDMGPSLPFQWRYCGAQYDGSDSIVGGIDQISNLILGLRSDPHRPQHLIVSWNVPQLSQMIVLPRDFACQFFVSADKQFLDCMVNDCACDVFLDLPRNITFYALLTAMIAHVCHMRPRRLLYNIAHAYLYNSHGEQINRQAKRTPRPFPRLSFRAATKLQEIENFNFDSFIIEGYTSWPAIFVDTV
jgi:dihydrofolate reductase/thymidylate synthase